LVSAIGKTSLQIFWLVGFRDLNPTYNRINFGQFFTMNKETNQQPTTNNQQPTTNN